MQIVMYVAASGEATPDHAKVTEVDASTAEAVRPQLHGAVDEILNDIKAGKVTAIDAAAIKATADHEVAAAEAALERAKQKQADAEKVLAAAPDAESGAKAGAATSTGGSGGTRKTGALPEDFPAYDALVAADLDTYGKVRKAVENDTLTETKGIGSATAEKIKAAL